jgi:uncharacterized membrane protein
LQQPLATAELPLKLVALWPKFLSYTISFVILGVYWVGTTFNGDHLLSALEAPPAATPV